MSRFSIGVLLESFRLPVGEALTQAQGRGAGSTDLCNARRSYTRDHDGGQNEGVKKYARRKWACGFCTVRRPR